MTAADMLRTARRDQGLTQRALAEIAGVPQSNIARIESGAIQPRFDTMLRLLSYLNHRPVLERERGVGVDRTLIGQMLRMSPRERIENGAAAANGFAEIREAFQRSAQR